MALLFSTDRSDDGTRLATKEWFDFGKKDQRILLELQSPCNQLFLREHLFEAEGAGNLFDQQMDKSTIFTQRLIPFCRFTGIDLVKVGINRTVLMFFPGQGQEGLFQAVINSRVTGTLLEILAVFFQPDSKVQNRFE